MQCHVLGSPSGVSSDLMVVLAPGDELHASLCAAAAQHGIEGAMVSGIGAVDDLELGYFSLPEKTYIRRLIRHRVEAVSLMGNLSLRDGTPFLHVHGLFTGVDFGAFGGHVFKAVASITLEMMVLRTGPMRRVPSPEFGLTRICGID